MRWRAGKTIEHGASMTLKLFTPGPLSTAPEVRAAMDADWGSRDPRFIELTATVRRKLLALAGGGDSHGVVLLQGSGTYAIEACLTSFVWPSGRPLILVNGAYGRRMQAICRRAGITASFLSWDETEPVDPRQVDEALAADLTISHVLAVHCETTTGIVNPIEAIADVVSRRDRKLIVDCMSSFGCLDIDLARLDAQAIAFSSNKCLEGVPGLGLVIADKATLNATAGFAPSMSLDLGEQFQGFERTGEWRFTPPTQVVAALGAALVALEQEGGIAARHARYDGMARAIRAGMTALGFGLLLQGERNGPIIQTFVPPSSGNYDFQRLYDDLAAQDLIIYPGKVASRESLRIGSIGHLTLADVERLLAAVAVCAERDGWLAGQDEAVAA
jgi:2-aminoethylphosphonate-pyruvate transaminase